MRYSDLLQLDRGGVAAIVGSGGKTSLLFRLAEENRGETVLVSTTTKMGYPRPGTFDRDISGGETPCPGINLLFGEAIGWKVTVPEPDCLASACGEASLSLLECDGSKCLPLKGWAAHEPVVPDYVTMTIGVLPLWALGQVIDEQTVHRLGQFCEITGAKPGEIVTMEHLVKAILHPCGLFAKACGRRVLFLNFRAGEPGFSQARMFVEQHGAALSEAEIHTVLAGDIHSGSGEVIPCVQ